MIVVDRYELQIGKCKRVHFIRVDVADLSVTILDIISSLNDLSWINKFDKSYKKESFLARAKPTADALSRQLLSNHGDKITKETGEYIVSEVSRKSIIQEFDYLAIPLSELLGRKLTGNPGFDFFTVNDCNTIIFGEAKYLSNQNAYGSAFAQVVKFIDLKKDIADLKLIDDFCNDVALNKVVKGDKGFAIGFSAKTDSTEDLITNITRNKNFLELLKYEEIIIVAVNI